jgi:hypothetical protein
MGRDNQPKHGQHARKAHKEARRAEYPRILIVTEGSKTEPRYFKEIQVAYDLHSANVQVQPSQLGTAPIQVVLYARQLFEKGDLHKRIAPRVFDQVYAVFDRDDHISYHDALKQAASLDGKLKNDNNQLISFKAIASVPSFELWLLLHFEDIQAPIHRDKVMQRLRKPGNLPGYEKGAGGAFATTRHLLETATQRAEALACKFTAYDEPEPYTAVGKLVARLTTLRCH